MMNQMNICYEPACKYALIQQIAIPFNCAAARSIY
jgi:hypothetical protein